MERFAIVQWEDMLSSIVNLDKVKFPRKPVSEYTEGDYVIALYGKQAFKARISEISDNKMTLLAQQTKSGEFPLQYTYVDFNEESDKRKTTEMLSGSSAKEQSSEGRSTLEGHQSGNGERPSFLSSEGQSSEGRLTSAGQQLVSGETPSGSSTEGRSAGCGETPSSSSTEGRSAAGQQSGSGVVSGKTTTSSSSSSSSSHSEGRISCIKIFVDFVRFLTVIRRKQKLDKILVDFVKPVPPSVSLTWHSTVS